VGRRKMPIAVAPLSRLRERGSMTTYDPISVI